MVSDIRALQSDCLNLWREAGCLVSRAYGEQLDERSKQI